jgi:hypothetical protein
MEKFELKVVPGVPETEQSPEFLQRMVSAMGVSFFKYGAVADAYPQKVSALDSLLTRLTLYRDGGVVKGKRIEAGNRDYLTDVANFAMIEFMAPSRPQYSANDDKDSPGREFHHGTSDAANLTDYQKKQRGL